MIIVLYIVFVLIENKPAKKNVVSIKISKNIIISNGSLPQINYENSLVTYWLTAKGDINTYPN